MDITSLLITFVGIIVIVALFILTRLSKNKKPESSAMFVPTIKDENGNLFTSILDDIPARDGTPIVETSHSDNEAASPSKEKDDVIEDTTQHILFISSKNDQSIDGNKTIKALATNGFKFGEMDIYHYFIETNFNTGPSKLSLVRVANGMDPWTLKRTDLEDKQLAGLSVIMQIPNKVNKKQAMATFINISEQLCASLDGVLKNQHQAIFTEADRDLFFSKI